MFLVAVPSATKGSAHQPAGMCMAVKKVLGSQGPSSQRSEQRSQKQNGFLLRIKQIGEHWQAFIRILAEGELVASLKTRTFRVGIALVTLFTALVSVIAFLLLSFRTRYHPIVVAQPPREQPPSRVSSVVEGLHAANQADSPTPSTSPESDLCFKGSCYNPTSSGHCPTQLLAAYDAAYREVWPGSVDLLLRYYINVDIYRVQILFRSIDLFWPKNIGDIVVVLDEGNQWGASLLPPGVKIFYETNYLNLEGKVLQQWSYLWADRYCTAEFISVVDDDTLLVMKVIPSLLFNLTTGKPYVLGHKANNKTMISRHHFVWKPSTEFLLGEGSYWGMFMSQLPFTFPRAALPRFREFSGRRFPHANNSFDAALQWWGRRKHKKRRYHICHTVLGNYMALQMADQIQVVEENAEDPAPIPLPRTGSHLSYNPDIYKQKEKVAHHQMTPYEFQKLYVDSAGPRLLAGTCDAFPDGGIEECAGANATLTKEIWMYVDWTDWHRIFKTSDPNATVVYDNYKAEMKCMYDTLTQGCSNRNSYRKLEEDLSLCIRRDSSY